MEIRDRGVNLAEYQTFSAEEIRQFREAYKTSHGAPLAAYEFWLEFKPSVVKRHRLQARWTAQQSGRDYPLPSTMGFLYLYTLLAYEEGIRYETQHCLHLGASRSSILQLLELAFARSGPRGMDAVFTAAAPVLRAQPVDDPQTRDVFPPHWTWDSSFYATGCDPTTETISPAELSRIVEWYRQYEGRVPRHVELLASRNPALLKAYRARIEVAMEGSLPVQALPYVELQAAVAVHDLVLAESALRLASGVGLRSQEAMEAIGWGSLYGGPEIIGELGSSVEELYGGIELA